MSNNRTRTTQVLDIQGNPTGEISLPQVFETKLRLDLIRKAAIAQQSHRFQPQGRNLMAGKRTTAESFGVGRGISRVPRVGGHGSLSGTAAFAPGTVGGRSAFPPVTLKKLARHVNVKERRLALKSAIAATASDEVVKRRGHRYDQEKHMPLVVSDEVEKVSKSSEGRQLLISLGVWGDIARVKRSKKIKAGHRVHSVGPLVVLADDRQARMALRNFEGVDVVRAEDLSVEILAPGTHPGRLTIWSESAIKRISEKVW